MGIVRPFLPFFDGVAAMDFHKSPCQKMLKGRGAILKNYWSALQLRLYHNGVHPPFLFYPYPLLLILCKPHRFAFLILFWIDRPPLIIGFHLSTISSDPDDKWFAVCFFKAFSFTFVYRFFGAAQVLSLCLSLSILMIIR